MTPSGTRTFCTCRPLGRTDPSTISPTGSGNACTWRMPSAMSCTRVSLRARRSSMASLMPPCLAASKSSRFAARMSAHPSKRACAMPASASFFCPVEAVIITRAARRAASPCCSRFFIFRLLSQPNNVPMLFPSKRVYSDDGLSPHMMQQAMPASPARCAA